MKVRLTATTALGAWLKENESIIGFDSTEVTGETYDQFVGIEVKDPADFYKLICNLTSEGDSVIVHSADESECEIEIYNDYGE